MLKLVALPMHTFTRIYGLMFTGKIDIPYLFQSRGHHFYFKLSRK